jgi:putative FmdB family regulatory protein
MPTYDYRCPKCEWNWETVVKISDRDIPLSEPCPNCGAHDSVVRTICGAPIFGDPVRMGRIKPDNGFKEVLQKIHQRTPGSQLNTTSTIRSL